MDEWGPSLYGDPCRECGFTWNTSVTDAVSLVAGLPTSIGDLVRDTSGSERHPDLAWSVTAYVCHVADNLRIWAERMMGVLGGGTLLVGNYDEEALAVARSYEHISLPAALWSLTRSVDDWRNAVDASPASGVVMVHPLRGDLELDDVVLATTHDARHHQWDIERTLQVVAS